MGSSVRLGTIGGIAIGIHFSWLLVFLLIAWTLATGLFPVQLPGFGQPTYWLMGLTASLLLFVSVLIHELAHSFVAEARGLKVREIILFIFGGVSNISGEPSNARDELLIAAAGPLSSLVIGVLLWGLWLATGPWAPPVQAVLLYLAGINILLAIFNLIPGFPLDGGRVLRAAVWWITGSLRTATRVAVASGHLVSFLFVAGGIYLAFTGALISGLWLVLIGWFIGNAASASGRQTETADRFRGVTVRDVMNPSPARVEPETPISEVVHDLILQRVVRALPVVEGERLVGMVTLNEIRGVERDRWDDTPVGAVMIRRELLQTVRPQDDLNSALTVLAQYDVNQLPVVDDGRMVGLLSRSNVIQFLQIREELGIPSEEEEEHRKAA